MSESYKKLLEKYQELMVLGSIYGVLYWDMNTFMPPKAIEFRAKQFNWLSRRQHEIWTDKEFSRLLNESLKENSLDQIQKRNVELIKREYENQTIVPASLVGQLAEQSNRTLEIWKKAKHQRKFDLVRPDLEKLFELNFKKAELLAKVKGTNDPYDALIATRDPGFSIKVLNKIFSETKKSLTTLLRKCLDSDHQPDDSFLSRKVDRVSQARIVEELAKFLHYDRQFGNIHEVEHPLTIGCGPRDVRVTVKYVENKVMKATMAAIHECGHAIHGLQGNPEWLMQPVYRISSPSFGESQSRMFENIVGLSREFWQYFYPRFQQLVNGTFNDINLDDFYFAINKVKPSTSRMAADEVTYGLHIIIRFEIERDLFDGKITVKELPEVWNQKYADYLEVEVPDDTLGVMQDLHWYSQYWGYFFGYAVGDIIAAQLAAKGLSPTVPEWKTSILQGSFMPIKEWFREKVHYLGGLYDSLELVEKITGEPLKVKYFSDYLENKYLQLYQ